MLLLILINQMQRVGGGSSTRPNTAQNAGGGSNVSLKCLVCVYSTVQGGGNSGRGRGVAPMHTQPTVPQPVVSF